MAARQDQGLQIGLIVSIFLLIVSFVFAYVYWKSYSDATQQIAQLNTNLSGVQQAQNQLQTEAEAMRQAMGFGANDNAQDVASAVEEDMKLFGAGTAEENRSYRAILKAIHQELQDTAKREAAAKDQIKDLTNRLQAVEGETAQQIAQFKAALDKAQADLAAERASFTKDRENLERTKQELMAKVDDQKSNFEAQLASRNQEFADLQTKYDKSERARENLKAEREQVSGSFEVADGRVSWVNQNGTVWINLGEADALRPQITFSVFDGDETDAAKAEKKGSIEVTRILGEHMAEARITDDDPRNPILTGDAIYSQVWHRGKKLRFAITGIIDIDGDGTHDLELARNLIQMNGGELDAYVDDQGQVQGEMSVNTRYLVLGKFPESGSEARFQDAWNFMNEDAATNGVETITLDDFLNQMGYRPQDRTVRLDSRATASDFPPRALEGSTGAGSATSPFRPRTPYNSGGSRPASTPY